MCGTTSARTATSIGDIMASSRKKLDHLVAGVSGGVASTLLLHPLDVVKIRFAVDDGKVGKTVKDAQGVMNAMRLIIRNEGIAGLYRGVTPNVVTAGMGWGLYFWSYNGLKAMLKTGNEIEDNRMRHVHHLLAATWGGVVSLVVLNPITVVKTRLIIQKESPRAIMATHGAHSLHYSNSLDAFFKIYKFEGLRGLFKGLVPGFCGVVHGAIQFVAYEEMKTLYNIRQKRPPNQKLTTSEYLGCAAASKVLAAVITYPYQVVRARMQDQYKDYKGMGDVVTKTFRHEGLRGFYKGLAPYLMHVTPNICLVFIIYEKLTAT